MLTMPLTGLPVIVLVHGAILDSTLPGPNSYPFRNGFWVMNVMRGAGTLDLLDRKEIFSAGSVVVTPPGVWHTYHVTETVPFLHVHFRAFGDGVPFPIVQHLGDRASWVTDALREAGHRLAAEPERATSVLWYVLWQLAAGPARCIAPIHHPLITQLLAHVSDRLHLPLLPADIANQLSVTPRHLNRLCTAALAMPLAAYIRAQRLARARHLLEESETPIQEIARMVGYPDLQHFSKLVRQKFGEPPRILRERRTLPIL